MQTVVAMAKEKRPSRDGIPVENFRFCSCAAEPKPLRWRGVALSLLLHAALIVGLGLPHSLDPKFALQSMKRPTRLVVVHLPERFYFSNPAPAPAPLHPAPRSTHRAGAPKIAKAMPAPAAPSEPVARPPARIWTPPTPPAPTPQRPSESLVVSDPTIPVPAAPIQTLPSLLLWRSQQPLPKNAPFVAPPSQPTRERLPEEVVSAAAPVLPSTLQMAGLPAPASLSSAQQALARAPQPNSPMLTGPAQPESGDDPARLLSLSRLRAPIPDAFVVPPSNFGTTVGASGAGANAEPSGAGSPARGASGEDAGGAKAGGTAYAGSRATTPAPPAPELTRIVQPANGNFDVIVIQSSSLDIAGARGVLKGKPIYTAYMPVGKGKPWIMQYCLPPSAPAPPASDRIVRLDGTGALAAPFPTLILRPGVTLPEGMRYLIVSGVLTAEGKLDQLTLLRDVGLEYGRSILAILRQWQFRPAHRDGRPVQVQVLLAIPPSQS